MICESDRHKVIGTLFLNPSGSLAIEITHHYLQLDNELEG
jgi:phosphoglucomutase